MRSPIDWVVRMIAVLVVVPSTFSFISFLPFALIDLRGNDWIAIAGPLIVALAAGWLVWRMIGSSQLGALASMCLGAILVGAIGFAAGFLGPIIFSPNANQGPLLGIFITGPVGFVIGGIGGLIYGHMHGRGQSIKNGCRSLEKERCKIDS